MIPNATTASCLPAQVLTDAVVSRDLTDQMPAERELREGDERYRSLLALSPDGINVVDQTGRILMCSEQFAWMHGDAHSGEIIGRQAAEFTVPEAYVRLLRESGMPYTRTIAARSRPR